MPKCMPKFASLGSVWCAGVCWETACRDMHPDEDRYSCVIDPCSSLQSEQNVCARDSTSVCDRAFGGGGAAPAQYNLASNCPGERTCLCSTMYCGTSKLAGGALAGSAALPGTLPSPTGICPSCHTLFYMDARRYICLSQDGHT